MDSAGLTGAAAHYLTNEALGPHLSAMLGQVHLTPLTRCWALTSPPYQLILFSASEDLCLWHF